MKNYRKHLILYILAIALFNITCSDQDSSDYSLSIGQSFFVEQGSGQCGPTSFYMIFKFYGDNTDPGIFRELPDCDAEIDLRENLTIVTKDSAVSKWLGVTDSGITITKLKTKISGLTIDRLRSFYYVSGNTDDNYDNKFLQLSLIYNSFLRYGIPVIIHLRRPNWGNIQIFSGHFMVLAGYNNKNGTIYYIDPNKNNDDPVVQTVSVSDFLNTNWYHSPDYSSVNPVPDAYWDGTWIGFTHAR